MKNESSQSSGESSLDAQLADLQALGPDFDASAEALGDAAGASPTTSQVRSGELFGGLVAVLCNVVAVRRGDHWQLSQEESEDVGNALAAVIDKYVPDMEAGPEFALVVTCGAVFGPRLLTDLSQVQQGEGSADADQRESKPAQ